MGAGTKLAIGLGIAAVLAVAFRPTEVSAEGTASLVGFVKDANNLPLDDVTVRLNSYSTQTDINGYFNLTDLVPGNYILEFSKPGYQTVDR